MSLISWLISPSRAGKEGDNKEETEEQEKPELAILDSGSEDERDDNIFVKNSEDIFSSAAFGKRPRIKLYRITHFRSYLSEET